MTYKYVDYFDSYGRIMQFNKNKKEPIHRWYPFVEGYSREFISSILDEVKKKKLVCLEPFSGSGTTALELQNRGFQCYSFEVNPLMYVIAKVKLENTYEIQEFNKWFDFVCVKRNTVCTDNLSSVFTTLYQKENSNKWNYDISVAKAITKLIKSIISIDNQVYQDLFMVALSAILLDVSNLYRNGKCLSYKKNWKSISYDENYVFSKFDSKIKNELLPDIQNIKKTTSVSNKKRLFNQDSRVGIEEKIADNSIDLVITSPPYLNSRDYTDTYMLELKTLYFDNYKQIKDLRKQTIRSHVQVKWNDQVYIQNKLLNQTLDELSKASSNVKLWNDSIIDMIRLYFVDMQIIFQSLYKKMKKNGSIYFNVSNSAYFNTLINTLDICASIAEDIGFNIIEIRKARNLKSSPQQKEKIGKLLEGVIVLKK